MCMELDHLTGFTIQRKTFLMLVLKYFLYCFEKKKYLNENYLSYSSGKKLISFKQKILQKQSYMFYAAHNTIEKVMYVLIILSYFSTFYIILHSANRCFSRLGRFWYRLRPYCRLFLFLLHKNFDTFHEPYFVVFLCFLIISS